MRGQKLEKEIGSDIEKPGEKKLSEVIGGIGRFQKVNILFLCFSILSLLINLMEGDLETKIYLSVPFIPFLILFTILLFTGENPVSQRIQVIFLLLVSFFIISMNDIFYQVGYILLIFVIFLSRKYGIFLKTKIFNIAIIFFLLLSIFISLKINPIFMVDYSEVILLSDILNQISFFVTTFLLIFIVFEDDIKRLTLENKRLTNQIAKSKVFINLGENVSGLVHNMKGDIGLISMSLSLLSEDVDHKAIRFLEDGNIRLQNKIKNILTLAKYSQIEEEVVFSINSLISSLVEVYCIDKEFKKIKISMDLQKEFNFFGNISEVSQVFENLIRNTYEALLQKMQNLCEKERERFTPKLNISINRDESNGQITFSDNGPGIKSCMNMDCKNNCLDLKCFKVGKTTKAEGTGLGMISVIRTLKKYKGNLKIKTGREGTTIAVILPGVSTEKASTTSIPVNQKAL